MTKRKPKMTPRSTAKLTLVAKAPPTNGGAVLCVCGRAGIYTGCSQQNKETMLVAFECSCGEVWGFSVKKSELERYRA